MWPGGEKKAWVRKTAGREGRTGQGGGGYRAMVVIYDLISKGGLATRR